MRIIYIILCFQLVVEAQLPLIQREDIGKPITQFGQYKDIAAIDYGYRGEIWNFNVNGYDFIPVEGKIMRYFFHTADNTIPYADTSTLVAIQFFIYTDDSLEVLNAVEQFSQIIRDNGNQSFYADLINGGESPAGVGGGTTNLTKVYKTNVPHLIPGTYNWLNHSGTLVINLSRFDDFYAILNFYPKSGVPEFDAKFIFRRRN